MHIIWKIRNLYLELSFEEFMLEQNNQKTEQMFKKLLDDFGQSEKVVAELWKWYEPSKKGVASF